jgi:citrate lyase subunit beta/citryl-CoA lyase
MPPAYRSLLFVPGHRTDLLSKAARFGCDALILDLLDLVPDDEKVVARTRVAEAIASLPDTQDLLVRVSPEALPCLEDLRAVVRPGLSGIMLPHSTDPLLIREVDGMLSAVERQNGVEHRSVRLLPLIEDAEGVVRSRRILLASPRISEVCTSVSYGGDMWKSVGFGVSPGLAAVTPIMAQVQLSARSVGVRRSYISLTVDAADTDGARAAMRQALAVGFTGAMVITPRHAALCHEIFTPGEREVERAAAIVAAFEQAGGRPTFHGHRVINESDVDVARDVLDRAAVSRG